MTETDYILVTNKTALMGITDLARQLLAGDGKEWGITEKERGQLCRIAQNALDSCFAKIREAKECSTCHGRGEIQTRDWPAMYDVCPECSTSTRP